MNDRLEAFIVKGFQKQCLLIKVEQPVDIV